MVDVGRAFERGCSRPCWLRVSSIYGGQLSAQRSSTTRRCGVRKVAKKINFKLSRTTVARPQVLKLELLSGP